MIQVHTKEVTDETYKDLIGNKASLEKGPWVAGGSVRKVWHGQPWQKQDVDFFFADKAQYDLFCNKMCNLPQIFTHQTENATTFHAKDEIRIQAVKKRFYSGFMELIMDFDFNLAQFVTDGKVMIATSAAISDCLEKRLRANPHHTKKVTTLRVLKYAAYGFDPDPEILLQVIKAMQEGEFSGSEY